MLKVHTTKLGNVAVICMQGKIVRGETDALRRAALSQADANVIVLDLARVNTIDAHGLGVMLELREHLQSRGIEFRLKNVVPLVSRVLEITKLNSVFKTAENQLLSEPLLQQRAISFALNCCAS